MKILHTSDWHIGRSLYGRKRYEEMSLFFSWLLQTIEQQAIDVLVVAGDIFDTSTPSNLSQQLYFQLIKDLSGSCCRHVVIVGGNHDSPSLLEAPKELLRHFNVHVTGKGSDNPEDELLVLKNDDDIEELIVCTVPYLRDREIRTAAAGEHIDDKNRKLVEGITRHYRAVVDRAITRRTESGNDLPIIATGHLFVAGGKKVEGDGVRDLYVGSLAHVPQHALPQEIDYLALGHLHSHQRVGNREHWCYSGSPLPMSFHEAEKSKCILIAEFSGNRVDIVKEPVPRFQRLESIHGTLEEILTAIALLVQEDQSIWLEVIYEGEELVTQLQSTLREAVQTSKIEILRIVNNRLTTKILQQNEPRETLDSLTEDAVFRRCLELHQINDEQSSELLHLFGETLQSITDEDKLAE